jgi:hypothetical protein
MRGFEIRFLRGEYLWSSDQSLLLQIQRPGFNSWHYQIF